MRFETLIERYHDEIFRYLWRLLHNAGWSDGANEAQDLTQDVFIRAYQAYGRLRSDSNHRAWLYKIATNCAYTAMRRDQREAQQIDEFSEIHMLPADADQSPDQHVALSEALKAVQQRIADLPPKQEAAVVLRYVQGLKYAEIADVLDCSQDSARANVYQGLRRLRRELGPES
ncbi:MAG: sigma-70 family RNA polymerase sigma factor [Burkholderiales bacterium]|nr:sigma-70 family RNA polymerase sigma factor [Burkholderiales bacterium]